MNKRIIKALILMLTMGIFSQGTIQAMQQEIQALNLAIPEETIPKINPDMLKILGEPESAITHTYYDYEAEEKRTTHYAAYDDHGIISDFSRGRAKLKKCRSFLTAASNWLDDPETRTKSSWTVGVGGAIIAARELISRNERIKNMGIKCYDLRPDPAWSFFCTFSGGFASIIASEYCFTIVSAIAKITARQIRNHLRKSEPFETLLNDRHVKTEELPTQIRVIAQANNAHLAWLLTRETKEYMLRAHMPAQIQSNSYDICAICRFHNENGSALKILNCDHKYHRACINSWLALNNNTCPYCRAVID